MENLKFTIDVLFIIYVGACHGAPEMIYNCLLLWNYDISWGVVFSGAPWHAPTTTNVITQKNR